MLDEAEYGGSSESVGRIGDQRVGPSSVEPKASVEEVLPDDSRAMGCEDGPASAEERSVEDGAGDAARVAARDAS